MSDLVERLRDREFFSRTGERHELLAAADRIEALEAALREILNIGDASSGSDWGDLTVSRDIARAALAKRAGEMSRKMIVETSYVDDLIARIKALEAALRAIEDVSLDKDHEAATLAITAIARAALAPESEK